MTSMHSTPAQLYVLLRRVIPPVYFISALVLMVIADRLLPLSHLIYTPLRIMGVMLAITGLIIAGWSIWLFKRDGTPLKPFEKPVSLIRTGPFHYSRNPIYLGMLFILAGTWIGLGSFTPLLVVLLFFFIIREAFVKEEEHFMEAEFADAYRQYCQSVRRWI